MYLEEVFHQVDVTLQTLQEVVAGQESPAGPFFLRE